MKTAERAWTVADVMVEDVVTAEPTTPYKVLVEKLWLQGISGLPVVDDRGRLVGIVSEMDLMSKQEHGGSVEAMELTRRLSRLMPEEMPRDAHRAGQGGRSDRRRPADVTRSAGDMSAPCAKRARRAHPALITALRRPEPSRQVLRAQPKSAPSRRPTRS